MGSYGCRELMAAVSSAGMAGGGADRQSNLFAMVKFYKEGVGCRVKPLIGVDGIDSRTGRACAAVACGFSLPKSSVGYGI